MRPNPLELRICNVHPEEDAAVKKAEGDKIAELSRAPFEKSERIPAEFWQVAQQQGALRAGWKRLRGHAEKEARVSA